MIAVLHRVLKVFHPGVLPANICKVSIQDLTEMPMASWCLSPLGGAFFLSARKDLKVHTLVTVFKGCLFVNEPVQAGLLDVNVQPKSEGESHEREMLHNR